MDEHEDHELKYALVMPFVAVASKGGPHDDAAYCAGYEMGKLDAQLEHGVIDELVVPVREENAPQADLIAMRHGYESRADPEGDGWATLSIRRVVSE